MNKPMHELERIHHLLAQRDEEIYELQLRVDQYETILGNSSSDTGSTSNSNPSQLSQQVKDFYHYFASLPKREQEKEKEKLGDLIEDFQCLTLLLISDSEDSNSHPQSQSQSQSYSKDFSQPGSSQSKPRKFSPISIREIYSKEISNSKFVEAGVKELEKLNCLYAFPIKKDFYSGLTATILSLLIHGVPNNFPTIPSVETFYRKCPWISRWADLQYPTKLPELEQSVTRFKNNLNNFSISQVNFRIMRATEIFSQETACNDAINTAKFLMLVQATERYMQYVKNISVPDYVPLLFCREVYSNPDEFLVHLSKIGPSLPLEQVEIFLLADALAINLEIYYLPKSSDPDFKILFPFSSNPKHTVPLVTIDETYFNILLKPQSPTIQDQSLNYHYHQQNQSIQQQQQQQPIQENLQKQITELQKQIEEYQKTITDLQNQNEHLKNELQNQNENTRLVFQRQADHFEQIIQKQEDNFKAELQKHNQLFKNELQKKEIGSDQRIKILEEQLMLEKARNPSIIFPFEEIELVTENFNQNFKIGEGTFSEVFKARLCSIPVAIKRFTKLAQNQQSFENEVFILQK